jgi:hypothetical protein
MAEKIGRIPMDTIFRCTFSLKSAQARPFELLRVSVAAVGVTFSRGAYDVGACGAAMKVASLQRETIGRVELGYRAEPSLR